MGCEKSKHADTKPTLAIQKVEPKKKGLIEAKIVLLGDTSVGKSSIILRYCQNKFSTAHDVTIGGSYFQQNLTLSSGNQLKLHIWDTGGSERFRAMLPLYYRDAQAAIIVYDVSAEKSFNGVRYWVDELRNKCDMSKLVVALAANKCDLDD